MKISNNQTIQHGEQELIDAISADLNWQPIEEIIKKEHKLDLQENIEYRSGDLVVCNDQVAYQLEFDVRMAVTLLIDRQGNFISIKGGNDIIDLVEAADESPAQAAAGSKPKKK